MTHIIPPGETIIETKTCQQTGEEFVVTDAEQVLREKFAPTFDGVAFPFATPRYAPSTRAQIRMMFRNERNLYSATCGLTKKPMVSCYHPENGYTVYERDAWWSDGWRAEDYAVNIDFSQPFFEQFSAFSRSVPKMALIVHGEIENSPYINW